MKAISDNLRNSGITPETLAKKSGIKLDRIVSILNGDSDPTLLEIRLLSKVLKVSTDFLLSEGERFPEIHLLFRQAFKNDLEKYKADKIAHVIGNAFLLMDKNYQANFSLTQFPSLENTFSNARTLAGIFRQIYCKGDFIEPLLYLPRIVSEDLKCILLITDLGNDTDGASAIINNIPFILIAPRFEPRMLFTLAHELAHIISHHEFSVDFVKIDTAIVENSRDRFKDEAFANAFASELLMPEEGVGLTLKSIRNTLNTTGPIGDVEIIYLSRIYGVSFDVAAKRCEDLQLLPRGGAVSISEAIKKEYGTAEKRADKLNIAERPKIPFPKASPILIDSAINKINAGEISIGKASEILSVPMDEILSYKSNQ